MIKITDSLFVDPFQISALEVCDGKLTVFLKGHTAEESLSADMKDCTPIQQIVDAISKATAL